MGMCDNRTYVVNKFKVWATDTAALRFWASFGGRATYDVHLRLVGKRVVDLLLVLIELFLLGVTAEALRGNIESIENRRFRCNRVSLAQNFRYKGSPHQTLFLQKTTLCLKKTSPTFLAITREALTDFYNIWQKCYWENKQSYVATFSHLT